jgi:hypothetical protein
MTEADVQRDAAALMRRLLEIVDAPDCELTDKGAKNLRVRHQIEGAMLALDPPPSE